MSNKSCLNPDCTEPVKYSRNKYCSKECALKAIQISKAKYNRNNYQKKPTATPEANNKTNNPAYEVTPHTLHKEAIARLNQKRTRIVYTKKIFN